MSKVLDRLMENPDFKQAYTGHNTLDAGAICHFIGDNAACTRVPVFVEVDGRPWAEITSLDYFPTTKPYGCLVVRATELKVQ
jgi:hypothetical protein